MSKVRHAKLMVSRRGCSVMPALRSSSTARELFGAPYKTEINCSLILMSNRDSLNSGLNILAHSKFVTKWLETLDEEGKSSDDTAAAAATTTTTTETPTTKRKSILGLFNDFLKPNPKAEETPKSNE